MRIGTGIFVAFLIVVSNPLVAGAQSPWVEKAKAEKEVKLYGTMNIPQMQTVIKSFEKKYPFIKVRNYSDGGKKLAQKIATEIRAGRYFADVYQISGAEMFLLKRQGYLNKYESSERKHTRDIYKDKGGYWTGIYANLEFIGYNKTLVSAREAPRGHNDLLDPKWKGKIAIDPTDIEWYITQVYLLGEAKAKEFMQRFARQELQVRRGHTLLAQLLAAGEFSLLMTLRDNTGYSLIQKGAPIDWVAIEPVIPNPANAVALPNRPPHPNAARLFIDYVLSREGQGVMRTLGRNITRVDLDPLQARVKKLKYGKIDWADYMGDYKKYEAEFRELFVN